MSLCVSATLWRVLALLLALGYWLLARAVGIRRGAYASACACPRRQSLRSTPSGLVGISAQPVRYILIARCTGLLRLPRRSCTTSWIVIWIYRLPWASIAVPEFWKKVQRLVRLGFVCESDVV